MPSHTMRKNAKKARCCKACGVGFMPTKKANVFCSLACANKGKKTSLKPEGILSCTMCLRNAGVSMKRIPRIIPTISSTWIFHAWKKAGFQPITRNLGNRTYSEATIKQREEAKEQRERLREIAAIEKAKPRESNPFVLEGLTFGRLTVVQFIGKRTVGNGSSLYGHWLCKCDCGGAKIALQHGLLKGDISSCGCLKADLCKREKFKRKISEIQRIRWDSDNPKVIERLKIKKKLRQSMKDAIKRIKKSGGTKDRSTIAMIGCSLDDCRSWIESQFKRGMTWANHGTKWHIDHIMPLSKFDLTNEEHRRLATRYTNLQPLWKHENEAKSDDIIDHQAILI